MPVVEVKNLRNETVGQLDLRDEVFGVELKETLIWEAIRHYMACGRRGTHKTKGRGEVSGSNKKPWRQKGTGRARVGQARNPIWRKGGTVFGPVPREYAYPFPRKKREGALRSAISEKIRAQKILVVDALKVDSFKTKDFAAVLSQLKLDSKVLVVDNLDNVNVILASRNIPTVKFVPGTGVNIYDVLNHDIILFSRDAILQLQEVLAR